MNSDTLLIEIFTEELPPTILKKLSNDFSIEFFNYLSQSSLTNIDSEIKVFASPRRIGFQLTKVKKKAKSLTRDLKLIPKTLGYDKKGSPTDILKKKIFSLRSNPKYIFKNSKNINKLLNNEEIIKSVLKDIYSQSTGKQETLFLKIEEKGVKLVDAVQLAFTTTLKKINIPKIMTYQEFYNSNSMLNIKFIRPAHRITALHGEKILKVNALGLISGRITGGHRFFGPKEVSIPNASDYENFLEQTGKVIPNFEKRKKIILNKLKRKIQLNSLMLKNDLLEEITALCEFPAIYEGYFDKKYLNIPHECLIMTMQKNQKFIPVIDLEGKLTNKFYIVSNTPTKNPVNIINGNERVLKARLSDAEFFYNFDKQNKLVEKTILLKKIIYHNKLGNVFDRTQRLIELTKKWGVKLGLKPGPCERAALLSKADLTTKMVDEFPELQGIMGKYYSEFSGENSNISIAIEEHYQPRFSGDKLPSTHLGNCLGLADRMESILSLWSIGIFPSGEKDPMGLRRNAISILRILLENKINISLDDLILDTAKVLEFEIVQDEKFFKIKSFFVDRLSNILKEIGYPSSKIDAVLSKCDSNIFELPNRLESTSYFLEIKNANVICNLNKRLKNILRKEKFNGLEKTLDTSLFTEDAEAVLFKKLKDLLPFTKNLLTKKNQELYFEFLFQLQSPVERFFDEVLVNSEKEDLKNNRLILLSTLHNSMNKIADLSLLAE